MLIKIQLIQFIALFFLSISSVSTEQWQLYAMNMKATQTARGLLMMKNPPENRLSKFCKEAGFMSVVEVGQYFVIRNASEFQHTIACREYTLPRDDKASQPKGWIRGITRIGPILEVTTRFQHFKYGIEVRIESVNEDNSHSWVRISYGTVRYVKKRKMYQQAQEWLQPGRRQKQNLNREYSLGRQQPQQYMKEDGLSLNHQSKISSRTISRRKSSIFFDTIRNYIEKKMEQSNSTKSSSIYKTIIFQYKIGPMIDG